MRRVSLLVALLVGIGACTTGDDDSTGPEGATAISVGDDGGSEPPAVGGLAADRPSGSAFDSSGDVIPASPPFLDGPLDELTIANLERVYESVQEGVDTAAIRALGSTGDPRLGWVLSDLLRFFQSGDVAETTVSAFNDLMGTTVTFDPFRGAWTPVTNLMIAWDLPAFPGYAGYKERLFTVVEPGWAPFFADEASNIDWRLLSWGGVLIDDRPLGDTRPCLGGCIPALDDPVVTDAAGGSWYPDDGVVFAVTIAGESRAYPKNIMEVHEMVNDTLGGRRIGVPYCTLCGSAQAYLTDQMPSGIETPVLRTSGLLSRSNKVMYDLVTKSVFDTFLGTALSGPLREADVTLEQVSVIATTWGEWKAAHPDTTIVAEDGGIGRTYDPDPLGGRDAEGPIFPVGDVDPRLSVQEYVIGVERPDGAAIAFPTTPVRRALSAGRRVSVEGVRLQLDGGGVRAFLVDGTELATHQAFWFAWSQFRPDTLLWEE